jgi:rubredoxin
LKTLEDPMKTYLCIVCGFVYDETAGRPEDGIAPGTAWADVPESWACPECGVAKADFEMVMI